MSLKFCFVKHTGTHIILHILQDGEYLSPAWYILLKDSQRKGEINCFFHSAPLLITYWLRWSIGSTFRQWPEKRMGGYILARTLTPPADLEQIELETLSVGGSTTSWAPCCDTGLDLPQRKSFPKVCINTILPPCQVRPTCSTCPLPGLQLAKTAVGTFKHGPGHNSPKVGFWLIEPEDMRPSHWQILSAGAMLGKRAFHLAPGDSFCAEE